jgi:bifunctional NMN adenylyltransferase/nudix hydrolase
MSSKKYDLVVCIGRFQPLHIGHVKNFKMAADIADHVLVLIGSANQPRTIKNPFNDEERANYIKDCLVYEGIQNHTISKVNDYLYNENAWITEVQQRVFACMDKLGLNATSNVAILGHNKDESSYYLKSFPQWKSVDTGGHHTMNGKPIDATTIRNLVFTGYTDFVQNIVPVNVFDFLVSFCTTSEYSELVDEYNFIEKYKKQWANSPYAPSFMCSDAVVVQSGYVLLVKRGFSPGLGLWALPGGFVEQNLTCKDNAIKELVEETSIDMPLRALHSAITHEQIFDAPSRSLRGRTFTMAYLIELVGGKEGLPKVKGADDAKEAKWFPLSEIDNMQHLLFEDHYSILKHMLGRLK